jgi:hypothetical protein
MQKETEEIIKLRNEIRQDMKDYKLSMTVINHEKGGIFYGQRMNWFQKYLDTKIENDLKKLIELQYNNQTEQSHG